MYSEERMRRHRCTQTSSRNGRDISPKIEHSSKDRREGKRNSKYARILARVACGILVEIMYWFTISSFARYARSDASPSVMTEVSDAMRTAFRNAPRSIENSTLNNSEMRSGAVMPKEMARNWQFALKNDHAHCSSTETSRKLERTTHEFSWNPSNDAIKN
eukprot:6838484-Prymnesium_polylepis.2